MTVTDTAIAEPAAKAEPVAPVATREIPQVKEPPLIGSTMQMATDSLGFFKRCYDEYGPAYKISMLGNKFKVLAGIEAAHFMGSREGKDALRSKEHWVGFNQEYESSSALPGLDGEEHGKLRNILRRGYSRESIKGRYNELVEITDDAIVRDWKVGDKSPVVQNFQFMVTDQLGIMITGETPTEYVDDIRIMILNILNSLVTKQRPKFLLMNPRYKRAKQRVFELGDKIRADWESGNWDDSHQTLVDDIMNATRDDPHTMPEKNLRLHLTAPYVAGLDTVANTLGGCVYGILKHPEVHQRVLAEVDEFFASGPVEEQGLLKRLPVVNGAIMESLRLFPVAVALIRTANKDFVFEGVQIKEGEDLLMGICVPHLQEQYYPNPEKFDIDRYNADRNEHKQPAAFSPYGRGPHTCLGKSLAEIQLVLSIARLFYRLDMSLESPDYVLKRKSAPTPGPSMSFKIKVNGTRN